jgi:hypothetical protein
MTDQETCENLGKILSSPKPEGKVETLVNKEPYWFITITQELKDVFIKPST